MTVLDASAAVEVLFQTALGRRLALRIFRKPVRLIAPEILRLEVLQVLRRFLLSGDLSEERAGQALDDFQSLPMTYYSHQPLLGRVWELRKNYTSYDAAYLALAEAAAAELFTTDSALGESGLHRARVRLMK